MTEPISLNFNWDGEDYFSMSQLIKNREWTKTLIKKYLGEPCAICQNPHYRGAAPMKLYLCSLVLETERLNAFIEDKAISLQQSNAAKERSADRIKDSAMLVDEINVKPFKISYGALIGRSKNVIANMKNNNAEIFTIENAEEIMAVGLLFEQASPSMYAIDNSFGTPGVRLMRETMRHRILESIKINFPELGDVCNLIKKKVDLSSPNLDLDVLAKLH